MDVVDKQKVHNIYVRTVYVGAVHGHRENSLFIGPETLGQVPQRILRAPTVPQTCTQGRPSNYCQWISYQKHYSQLFKRSAAPAVPLRLYSLLRVFLC